MKEKNDEKLSNINLLNKIHKEIKSSNKHIMQQIEYTANKFNRLEQKNDSNFKYLNEKINNTKNSLLTDMTELFQNFSISTTKAINNLENKIKNEQDARKMEISKIQGINDYDEIILKNLESRISILEEESEKYNIN